MFCEKNNTVSCPKNVCKNVCNFILTYFEQQTTFSFRGKNESTKKKNLPYLGKIYEIIKTSYPEKNIWEKKAFLTLGKYLGKENLPYLG